MMGSNRSLRSARSLASVRSSSAPASLLYPATSAARMAASFQVSAMACPSPHARLAQLPLTYATTGRSPLEGSWQSLLRFTYQLFLMPPYEGGGSDNEE